MLTSLFYVAEQCLDGRSAAVSSTWLHAQLGPWLYSAWLHSHGSSQHGSPLGSGRGSSQHGSPLSSGHGSSQHVSGQRSSQHGFTLSSGHGSSPQCGSPLLTMSTEPSCSYSQQPLHLPSQNDGSSDDEICQTGPLKKRVRRQLFNFTNDNVCVYTRVHLEQSFSVINYT